MRFHANSLLFVCAALLSGCNVLGPRAIESARIPYNEAIAQTRNEQLLLNLVRLRYRDVPLFLDLTSVSTQYSWSAGASGSGSYPRGGAGNEAYSAGASLSFAEKPTITYVPLRGDAFVKQIMSPIPMESVMLLSGSGWSVDRVLRCCIDSLNGVPNAPSAAGPTPDYVPRYEEFARVGNVFRRIQVKGAMRLNAEVVDRNVKYSLSIDPDMADPQDVAELAALLGIETGMTVIPVVPDVGRRKSHEIALAPRSLLGTMFYLSQSVEVPEGHREAGLVTITPDGDGEFDWTRVTGDLLRVRSSSSRPAGAFVSVRYRGAWFYIDDSDLDSKSTFSLLTQLLALQSGEIKPQVPLLTLPVSR